MIRLYLLGGVISSLLLACSGKGSDSNTIVSASSTAAPQVAVEEADSPTKLHPDVISSDDSIKYSLITEAEWRQVTPVAREMLLAIQNGDLAAGTRLSVDSMARRQAFAWFQNSELVHTAIAKGMRRNGGNWRADTLIAEFGVPVRTMQSYCYSPGMNDYFQFNFVRLNGTWRILRINRNYC